MEQSWFLSIDVRSGSPLAENGGKTIFPTWGRVGLEVTSPIDSLTPKLYKLVVRIFVYLPPLKSFATSWICVQHALGNF